uniref:Uncharacterized protein n=1 Tax=Helicotheca tamesis TaxID=374047 RepID=A0A7S2IIV0_9STRA|mmetsp:Transcript_9900/g.13835  ORF Transcript_9900/g.13835 Transcript_9900/m.13835 type:complete len:217 (+) Transcript_9900:86-736(+)|eukprot:CAMPEP_0185725314 /NCGR_PEP_ID=MMETSP1171-20130828/1599_1 /TAXON_ID=374046 /ORGANISM="Helicotheca tamensis, Strain CCMP826" /LENGTH=216 /DNA_ID=CAMNT_0028393405 /DNA_START=30 /DNA_END=680 /DNA_ORIENTATION=-
MLRSVLVLLFASVVPSAFVNSFQTAVSLQPTTKGRTQTVLNATPKSLNDDTTRRSFLGISTTFATAFLSNINPASAKYGDSTNIELPSYIDFLIEKNNAGKIDQDKVLYKGADPVVLLKRLQEANTRLKEIPPLAADKKWSQIQGIVTGPLGTLSQTLNQIATPDSSAKVKDEAKKLKTVVIDIGQAASKKNGDACVAKAEQASAGLDSFVRAAFQ